MASAELQAIRNRMRAAERQIDALESLKHPAPSDHRRLAELHEAMAQLVLEEGLAGGDEPGAVESAIPKVVSIRPAMGVK